MCGVLIASEEASERIKWTHLTARDETQKKEVKQKRKVM